MRTNVKALPMPYCAHCGQSLPDEARFCAACGRPMAQPPAAQAQPEETQAMPTEPGLPFQAQTQPEQPPYQPTPTSSSAVATPLPVSDIPQRARNLAMLCHLISFAGFAMPFGNVLGPLLVWLLANQEHPSIDIHGKESVNFQISLIIFALISAVLILLIIGIVMLIALMIYAIIAIIMASVRAANGKEYRYPLAFRFLK